VKRQANVGAALAAMGRGEKVWPLLKHSPDPTRRSFLIDRLAAGGVDPRALLNRFDQEQDVSIKRALLLSLGEFGVDRLPDVERQNFLPRLLEVYRDDPDPGLHGAADWLVRRWRAGGKLKEIDKELATGKVEGQRQWYVNRQGQTMMLLPRPGEFWMGEGAERKKQRLDYSYAIAAKEVTVDQFLKFRKDHKSHFFSSEGPVDSVSWYDAAAYCNWLSEKEGIPPDQWCYQRNEKGEYERAANPTTGFSFGEPDELLGKYCWFAGNALGKSHPAGMLKPNDLGLFDMHGNAWEWCDDNEDARASLRVFRGSGWGSVSGSCRAASRSAFVPSFRIDFLGFRLARVPVGSAGK
jgi:hypothetical protein